jgi:signal transduction histidine kinase
VRLPRLTVRTRTALAAALALTPVLAAASIAGVLVQRHDLTDAVTLVAREHATAIAQQLESDGTGENHSVAIGEEDLVQVVEGGQVTDASDQLADRPPLAQESSRVSIETGLAQGEEDRYVVVTAPVSGSDAYVVSARSLESVDAAIASTTRLLAVGSGLVIVLVFGLTWVLTGRALRPVEGMRRQASQITQANLSARLPVPETGDEVARLAETMNAMLERLEQAVNTQRQFIADASHELRSPIATVRTLHETAHLGTHPKDLDELSAEVLGEIARLEALVADLLLLARTESAPLHPEPVDLADEVLALGTGPRRVPVSVAAPHPVWVEGEPRALSRMVRNLIDNAERHASTAVHVLVEEDESSARVVVADDGPGIPESEREAIFGRFVRLDEARARDEGGSGLGLAIVRQIAQRHGGTVTVAGQRGPGTGAVFVVALPPQEKPGPAVV